MAPSPLDIVLGLLLVVFPVVILLWGLATYDDSSTDNW
jgi:hypothetical protein